MHSFLRCLGKGLLHPPTRAAAFHARPREEGSTMAARAVETKPLLLADGGVDAADAADGAGPGMDDPGQQLHYEEALERVCRSHTHKHTVRWRAAALTS